MRFTSGRAATTCDIAFLSKIGVRAHFSGKPGSEHDFQNRGQGKFFGAVRGTQGQAPLFQAVYSTAEKCALTPIFKGNVL
jgi:hypothetical protein